MTLYLLLGRRRRMEATCFSPRRPFGISRRQRSSKIATTMTMMQTSSEVPVMFIFGYKSLMECSLMISLKLNVLQKGFIIFKIETLAICNTKASHVLNHSYYRMNTIQSWLLESTSFRVASLNYPYSNLLIGIGIHVSASLVEQA